MDTDKDLYYDLIMERINYAVDDGRLSEEEAREMSLGEMYERRKNERE